MRPFLNHVLRAVDPPLALIATLLGPLLYVGARLRWYTPLTRAALNRFGVGLIRHHYSEPIVTRDDLHKPLRERRDLLGIDLSIGDQIALAARLDYAEELLAFPLEKPSETEFGFHNGYYEAGDAEMLYDFMRFFKPRRLLEVGCGQSTLIARQAIAKNKAEDSAYTCEHICIEPYERPWLEKLGIEIVRQKVELCPVALFESLGENDILFIDSSHVLRPQGDVSHLYLSVLPRLSPGVIIHVHDVFTPRDYLEQWVEEGRLWNEQYVLEAFLSCNDQFRVVMALNMMATDHREALARACPVLMREPQHEPGAFWF
ncbi:MAG: class SAM-dependent methyltransferase [Rhodospirillales bacterium]|nr:class SAM-dependent methyltransferase [Rhodospirillales bacterium]